MNPEAQKGQGMTTVLLPRLVLAVLLLVLFWLLIGQRIGHDLLADPQALIDNLRGSGWRGPAAIIGLMMLAVVLNPLPSAPVALAAGALYGHGWGMLYVVIGATLGAVLAFLIARHVAADWVESRLGRFATWQRWNDQNRLMVVVLIARLLPFVSFDLASYAAGVTRLSLWRFLLATVIGLLPGSFLLAHVGGAMTAGDRVFAGLSVLALGVLTLLPVAWGWWRQRRLRVPGVDTEIKVHKS